MENKIATLIRLAREYFKNESLTVNFNIFKGKYYIEIAGEEWSCDNFEQGITQAIKDFGEWFEEDNQEEWKKEDEVAKKWEERASQMGGIMENKIIKSLKEALNKNKKIQEEVIVKDNKILKISIKDISEVIEGIPVEDTRQYLVELEYDNLKGSSTFKDIDTFFNRLEKDLKGEL